MTIIKEGKMPKEDTYQSTCKYCGCTVECILSEMSVPVYYDDYYYVKCPTKGCKYNIKFFNI